MNRITEICIILFKVSQTLWIGQETTKTKQNVKYSSIENTIIVLALG